MRLIDADALIEELHHMIEGDADLRKDYEYMGIDDCIRSIPTAYNVDAIVAELEYFAKLAEDRWSNGTSNHAYQEHKCWVKAIQIVRKGGTT